MCSGEIVWEVQVGEASLRCNNINYHQYGYSCGNGAAVGNRVPWNTRYDLLLHFPHFFSNEEDAEKKSIRNSAQTREKYTKHKITEESTTKNYEDKIPPEKNIY